MDIEPLVGQVALVTGGSRGLGKEFARALADAGASIAVLSPHLDACQRTVDDLVGAGATAMAVAADVTDREPAEACGRGSLTRARPSGHPGQQRRHRHQAGLAGRHGRMSGATSSRSTSMACGTARRSSVPAWSPAATDRSSTSARCPDSSSTARRTKRPTTPPRRPFTTSRAALQRSGRRSACASTPWRPGYVKTDMSPVDDPACSAGGSRMRRCAAMRRSRSSVRLWCSSPATPRPS